MPVSRWVWWAHFGRALVVKLVPSCPPFSIPFTFHTQHCYVLTDGNFQLLGQDTPGANLKDFIPYWETGTKVSSDAQSVELCFDYLGVYIAENLKKNSFGISYNIIWNSAYDGQSAYRLYIQDDGLLAVYSADCEEELWSPKVQLNAWVYPQCWPGTLEYFYELDDGTTYPVYAEGEGVQSVRRCCGAGKDIAALTSLCLSFLLQLTGRQLSTSTLQERTCCSRSLPPNLKQLTGAHKRTPPWWASS